MNTLHHNCHLVSFDVFILTFIVLRSNEFMIYLLLQFQEGDEVTVLETINQDWLYGEIGDKRGQFPSSFVSPLPDS